MARSNYNMDTVKEKLPYLVLILVVVGAASLLVGGPVQTYSTFPSSSACLLSSSDVAIDYFTSPDQEFSGEKSWVVRIGANCGDHVITGGADIQQDDLEASDPDSGQTAQAGSGAKAGVTDFNAWAYNKIRASSSDTVYAAGYNKITCEREGLDTRQCDSEEKTQCENWQNSNAASHYELDISRIEGRVGSKDILHCFRAEKRGEVAQFESSTFTDFDATISICADGTCHGEAISKADSSVTVGSGDQKAHVQWNGDLMRSLFDVNVDTSTYRPACENDCNNPINQVSWSVTTQHLYNSYYDSLTGFDSNVDSLLNDGFDPSGAADAHNSHVHNVLETDSRGALANSIGSWVDRIVFEAGQMRIYGDDGFQLINPTFTIRWDVDWLGLIIALAEPSIGDVQSPSLTATESTTVTVPVTNTGDIEGRVKTSISCPTPLQGDHRTQYLEPGQTSTYQLQISSGPSTTRTYDCTITAMDEDDTRDRYTATQSLTVNVESSCTDSDGDQVCDQFDDCPDTQGPEANNGCPVDGEDDRDNDGIPDSQDDCPTKPETYNLYQDSDGCPDTRPESTEICDNGRDDDGDGLIDERDPDCPSDDDEFPVNPWHIIIVMGVGGILYVFREPLRDAVDGVM